MKILLDECLPLDFRHSFPTHDAHTTQWAGLKNKKNGELVTVDQGIPHQQYSAGWKLSIILLRSRTNQIDDLLPLVDAIMQALATIQPGQTVEIPPSGAGSPAARSSSM